MVAVKRVRYDGFGTFVRFPAEFWDSYLVSYCGSILPINDLDTLTCWLLMPVAYRLGMEALMLNRQKALLHFIKLAGRPVSRYELTKWSFLLRHESESAGGSAFYDFLPYQYGPFSFALYQELDKLESQNYIQPHGKNECVLDEDVSSDLPSPGRSVENDIDGVLRSFSSTSRAKLTDYVYDRFPSYTVNSKLRQLEARPTAEPAVFTAGYQGRSVDSFIHLLIQSGVRRLIDVRKNPIARRYGFHRSTLDRLCGYLDIDYIHVPDLGISSDKRQGLEDMDDYAALFKNYERTTLKTETQSIAEVTSLVKDSPSVLVCMEANPVCCHRSSLANVVAKRSRLPIHHLGFENEC